VTHRNRTKARFAELDPETGKVTQICDTNPQHSAHESARTLRGMCWFTEMLRCKQQVAKLDAVTKKIHRMDPSPSDTNAHYYGMTVDQKDRVWAVGMTSHRDRRL